MPLHTSLSDCVINTLLSSPCIKPLQILFLFSTMQVLHLLRDLKSPFTLQMSLCLCGVKVYYLQSYKFIPNAFHRKQNSKQNLSIMALKFKITQACGKNLQCNGLLFPQSFREPISSKFNIHFPKQV